MAPRKRTPKGSKRKRSRRDRHKAVTRPEATREISKPPGVESPAGAATTDHDPAKASSGTNSDARNAHFTASKHDILTLGDEELADGPVVVPRPDEPDATEDDLTRRPSFVDLAPFIRPMEQRHVEFAFELVKAHGNRAAAARRAGVPEKSARQIGHNWSIREDVQALLGAILTNAARRLGVEADQVILQLWHEARSADDARARVTALQALLKALGADGPSKVELTGRGGGALRMQAGVTAEDIEKIRAGVLGQTKGTA